MEYGLVPLTQTLQATQSFFVSPLRWQPPGISHLLEAGGEFSRFQMGGPILGLEVCFWGEFFFDRTF